MRMFKKKMWFTIISTTLLFVLVIGTFVAVFSSSNITVNSNVSVQYDSTINANVAGYYWMDNANGKTSFIADQPISIQTEGSPGDIALNETDRYVIFEYVFTNNMVNLDAYGNLTYADDVGGEDKNIIVGYYISDVEIGIEDIESMTVEESNKEGVGIANVFLLKSVKTYVYIKARIDKLENNGEFSGTYHWNFDYEVFETDQSFFSFNGNKLSQYLGGAGNVVIVPASYSVQNSNVSNMNSENVELSEIVITSIDSKAFEDKKMLIKVVLPDSISNIGTFAFDGCNNLKNIEISNEEIEGDLLVGSTNTGVIGLYAFRNCNSLENIEIPSGVTTIDNWVFSNCKNLKRIELSSNIKYLGGYVFYNCGLLESVELPDGDWVWSKDGTVETGTALTEEEKDPNVLAINMRTTWLSYRLIRTDV